jgi:hypothetical protein
MITAGEVLLAVTSVAIDFNGYLFSVLALVSLSIHKVP